MYYSSRVMAALQRTLIIAASSCLALMAVGYIYERVCEARDARHHSAPGQLVSVGDHKLHLLCKGTVGPTVVIEQGAGEPAASWWSVQDKVSVFARVCTYDRAGYGWSDPVQAPRTIQERTEELHRLLKSASVPGPYILVAHSYGGFILRWFAREHRDEVAGLVLVDSAEEGAIFRPDVLAFYSRVRMFPRVMSFAGRFGLPRALRYCFPSLGEQMWFVKPDEFSATADDLASLELVKPPLSKAGGFGSLGDLPLIVVEHGQPFPGPFALLEKYWAEGQKRLAALSTNSLLIRANNSNHMIHLDEPGLVVDAIRRVHAAARDKAQLAHDGTSQELLAVRQGRHVM
jgi:pimeloyl-ACP methyl ester carboxylesterase